MFSVLFVARCYMQENISRTVKYDYKSHRTHSEKHCADEAQLQL
jgi:hypothetical protein